MNKTQINYPISPNLWEVIFLAPVWQKGKGTAARNVLTLRFPVGVGDSLAGVAEVAALDALPVAVGDAARVLLARVAAHGVVAHVAPDG